MNKFSKFFKNLKEKLECVFEDLFFVIFGEEKMKGKRSWLEISKIKESRKRK